MYLWGFLDLFLAGGKGGEGDSTYLLFIPISSKCGMCTLQNRGGDDGGGGFDNWPSVQICVYFESWYHLNV